MKANELMIGDWVLTLDATHTEQVHAHIWAIEEGQTCILVKKDICNWFVDIEWIEPIPLTQEILEKNGFEASEHLCWLLWDDANESLLIRLHNLRTTLAIATHGATIRIQYVHQLQHYFKLLGIEKDIEL